MNSYPLYKTLLWRFVRAGLWGGLSAVIAVEVVLQPDLSNFKPYGLALTAAFITGFLASLFKTLRDYISKEDPTHWINKLPL